MIVVIAIAIVGTLALHRSEVEIRGLRLVSPSPGIVAGQLAFTAIDILLAATTLYLLLPPSDLGFAAFLASSLRPFWLASPVTVRAASGYSRRSSSPPCPPLFRSIRPLRV